MAIRPSPGTDGSRQRMTNGGVPRILALWSAPRCMSTAFFRMLLELAEHGPVFFKDTTDVHYPEVLADTAFLAEDAVHTFLIRSPQETIASYFRLNPEVRAEQVGFAHQLEI